MEGRRRQKLGAWWAGRGKGGQGGGGRPFWGSGGLSRGDSGLSIGLLLQSLGAYLSLESLLFLAGSRGEQCS